MRQFLAATPRSRRVSVGRWVFPGAHRRIPTSMCKPSKGKCGKACRRLSFVRSWKVCRIFQVNCWKANFCSFQISQLLGELCYDPLANRLPELLKFKGFFEDRLFPGGQFLEVQSLPTNSHWIYSRLTPTQKNSIFRYYI